MKSSFSDSNIGQHPMQRATILGRLKVLVFTHIPSPYQVELFNAVALNGSLNLTVAYMHRSVSTRSWKLNPLHHKHIFFEDHEKTTELQKKIDAADLVIWNFYQHPQIIKLMHYRADSNRPWCFWGERPGYHRLGMLGVVYRKLKLSVLHKYHVPIWGIGKWAIDKYQQEFGKDRLYLNVPYYSDLERFKSTASGLEKTDTTFLYSGSLSHRKGVDLLAAAFRELAKEIPSVQLIMMGSGSMQQQIADSLKECGNRVKFVGFQAWNELPRFYHQAHFLCVPSRYDGWGLVVPEGLAAGLPVISTDRTGAALEFIKNDQNGWVVPVDRKKPLYDFLCRISDSKREMPFTRRWRAYVL
jgi:glycosyltransferase involved in cell wall biosynthesis